MSSTCAPSVPKLQSYTNIIPLSTPPIPHTRTYLDNAMRAIDTVGSSVREISGKRSTAANNHQFIFFGILHTAIGSIRLCHGTNSRRLQLLLLLLLWRRWRTRRWCWLLLLLRLLLLRHHVLMVTRCHSNIHESRLLMRWEHGTGWHLSSLVHCLLRRHACIGLAWHLSFS
jgi:hypothetical protein